MKSFLWMGLNMVQGGMCLVVWSPVQRPRQLGGGGARVLDPLLSGHALHLRWLWL
jgi:hypothetical protein